MMKISQALILSVMLSLMPITASLAQTAFDSEDSVDFKNNSGGAGQGSAGSRVMETSLVRGADDLDALKPDIGPSEAVADSGPAPSSIVNKHMAPVNAPWSNKTYFGMSLKSIQQMLNKYFITNPKLPNWWKQISESSLLPNNQSQKS